jgi:hypothetical protein
MCARSCSRAGWSLFSPTCRSRFLAERTAQPGSSTCPGLMEVLIQVIKFRDEAERVVVGAVIR